MTENAINRPPVLSGDTLIQGPQVVAWDTVVDIPGRPDEVWFWVAQSGAVNEGHGGWPLPRRYDRLMGDNRPKDTTDPAWRLKPGDEVKDYGPNDSRARVIEVNDPERTLVFRSTWEDKADRPGLDYSWQLAVLPGEADDQTKLLARTRMTNVKRPELWQRVGPHADRLAMRMFQAGLTDRVMEQSLVAENIKQQDRRMAATALTGLAAGLAARKATERAPGPMRLATSLVAVAAGSLLGRSLFKRK